MSVERPPARLVRVDEQEAAVAPDEDTTIEPIDAAEQALSPSERAAVARARRIVRFWRGGVGVWIGLLVVAGGFVLLAIAWSQTAALLDVAQQIPYLVSGGLVGLGLILVGLLVINLSVKRREAQDRARQLEEVREALVRLRATIEGESEDEQ